MTSATLPRIVAIDVGTSAVKVAAVNEGGQLSALSRATYPTYAIPDGGYIQEPEDWWRATLKAALETLQVVDRSAIEVVVISSQIGTHLLATAEGEPLTQAVTWRDRRSLDDQLALEREHGEDRLDKLLGVALPTSPNWPLARLRWFQREEAAVFRRARYIFQPKEFLVHRLTGCAVGDSSSWRGLVNAADASAAVVLGELGMPDLTVSIQAPTDIAGFLRSEAAVELGLHGRVRVLVGWNDLNCALLGADVVQDGQVFDLGGSSEHVGIVLNRNRNIHEHRVMEAPYGFSDGLPATARYGVTSNGGSLVEWCGAVFGDDCRPQELEQIATRSAPGSGGVAFLPYIWGERAPVWDPSATGTFVGVSARTQRSDLVRAVYEGAALNLRQILEIVGAPLGGSPVIAAGGTARSGLWNQIKADVLQRPIAVLAEPEAGIRGAAMIAAVGLGWHRTLADAASAMNSALTYVEPNPDATEIYEARYRVFKKIHPALRSVTAV